MHDFHIADKIAKLAIEYSKKNNFKAVTYIKIGLGQVVEHAQPVLAENLEFNLKMLLKKTIAVNAKIDIIAIEGDSWVLQEIEGDI